MERAEAGRVDWDFTLRAFAKATGQDCSKVGSLVDGCLICGACSSTIDDVLGSRAVIQDPALPTQSRKRTRSESHERTIIPSPTKILEVAEGNVTAETLSVAARSPGKPIVTVSLGTRKEGLPACVVGAIVDSVAHHGASLTRGLQSVATGARAVGVSLECVDRSDDHPGNLSEDSARTTGRALVEGAVAVTVDVAKRLPDCRDLGFSIDGKKWLSMSRKFVEVSIFGIDAHNQEWCTLLRLHEMPSTTAPELVELLADTVAVLSEHQNRLGLRAADYLSFQNTQPGI